MPPTPAVELQRELKQEMREPAADWVEKVSNVFFDKDTDIGPECLWKEIHSTDKAGTSIVVDHAFALRRLGYVMWDRKRTDEPICRETIRVAREDQSPTFLSPSRFMNPARAWDPQFRPKRPAATSSGTGRRAAGGARGFVRRSAAARPAAQPVVQPIVPTPATKAAHKAELSERELRSSIEDSPTARTRTSIPQLDNTALPRASISGPLPKPIKVPSPALGMQAVPGSSSHVGPAPGPSAGTAAKVSVA